MLALVVIAYGFGSAIRYNIGRIDAVAHRPALVEQIEPFASMVLAFAYIISVGYYLNLFGAFGVSLTAFDTPYYAKVLTTAVFLLILIVGWTKGFAALERMEQISVGVKLAIIGGLLCGLAIHFGDTAQNGALTFNAASVTGWSAVTLIFGLIVTVQGFETSRYLGRHYDAQTRIRSMR
jgi:amino acid transporter